MGVEGLGEGGFGEAGGFAGDFADGAVGGEGGFGNFGGFVVADEGGEGEDGGGDYSYTRVSRGQPARRTRGSGRLPGSATIILQ